MPRLLLRIRRAGAAEYLSPSHPPTALAASHATTSRPNAIADVAAAMLKRRFVKAV